jgi:hypothetical protein
LVVVALFHGKNNKNKVKQQTSLVVAFDAIVALRTLPEQPWVNRYRVGPPLIPAMSAMLGGFN